MSNITERDFEILSYLAFAKEASVDWLGHLFFATNPQRGTVNTRPGFAALIRLRKLKEARLVIMERGRVRASGRGAAQVDSTPPRPVAHQLVARHDAILAAAHHFTTTLAPSVGIISKTLGVTQSKRTGRHPDATFSLQTEAGPLTIALVVFNAEHAPTMIAQKGRSTWPSFDDVFFYADNDETAARVLRTIGETCRCA